MPFRTNARIIVALAIACVGLARAQLPAPASVQRVDDAIVFRGRIDHRSAADFMKLLQDGQVMRLVITSQGGLVGPALDMGDAIHARGIAVEVPESCLSSCANYIFPAGHRKLLGRPDAVGWHGNMAHVLHLQQTGQAQWSEQAMADARQLARREAEFFRRIGVDGFVCWFGKIAPHDVDEFYFLSVEDMERFGLRNVSIRQPPGALAAKPDVRLVSVDWTTLEAARPVVKLDE